jgi:hypothetical protein
MWQYVWPHTVVLVIVLCFCLSSSYVLCTQCCQFQWIVNSVSLTFIKSFYLLSSNVWFSDVPDDDKEIDTAAMYVILYFIKWRNERFLHLQLSSNNLFFSFQLKTLFDIFTFVSERNIKYQYFILASLILIACNRNSVSL